VNRITFIFDTCSHYLPGLQIGNGLLTSRIFPIDCERCLIPE
jgi:hypothetical protein